MSRFDFATLLKTALPELAQNDTDGWTFSLEPGASESVAILLLPYWACFGVALRHRLHPLPTPMRAILSQSAWPGNVKLVGQDLPFGLRAEVPLIVETVADRSWVLRQVGEVMRGLRFAATNRPLEASADDEGDCDADPELLADRCRTAGWHAAAKTDGEIHVDIEPRSVRRVVSIVRQKTTLRARVTLANGELAQASEESLTAVAHFLSRASSSLRFARAWMSDAGTRPSQAGFECAISACAGDSPLVTAIDALTTACDLFACEAEALIENAALARRYLQMTQGAHPLSAQPVVQPQLPTTAPALPLAAVAAVPVYATTLEGVST